MSIRGQFCFMFHDNDHWTHYGFDAVPYFIWCQRCHKIIGWREKLGGIERTVYGGWRDPTEAERGVLLGAKRTAGART